MSGETVSCVVPVHNVERFVLSALESVFRQTVPMHEIVVVADVSTDLTTDIVKLLGDRVTLIEVDHHSCTAARDAGVAAASGDYIAFLDADDIWTPEKTARQLEVLRRKPEVDLCVAHFLNFWDPEVFEEGEKYRGHPLSEPMSGYIVPTLIAPRSALDRFGAFDSGAHPSDTAWFARAISMGAVLEILPDVLLHRRLHRANTSRVNPSDSVDGLFDLIKARRQTKDASTSDG